MTNEELLKEIDTVLVERGKHHRGELQSLGIRLAPVYDACHERLATALRERLQPSLPVDLKRLKEETKYKVDAPLILSLISEIQRLRAQPAAQCLPKPYKFASRAQLSRIDGPDMATYFANYGEQVILVSEITQVTPTPAKPEGYVVECAKTYRKYLRAFIGQKFNDDPSNVDRINLGQALDHLEEASALLLAAAPTPPAQPVPMLLFCPQCNYQHVDAPQPEKNWTNPPHRSHQCQKCGHIWRPADVETNGVAVISTTGKHDLSPVPKSPDASALVEALKACERQMSEVYRLGLVDSLAPKGEHSAFTNAITAAREALQSAEPVGGDPEPDDFNYDAGPNGDYSGVP